MSPINKDDLLNVAVEAALAASNLVMEASDRPRVANHKGITDLVTETDLKSEKTIKAIIRSFYKDHTILAEETGQDTNVSDYLWIIDPLDGTTNFVHGYPSFAISIGLFYKNEPLVAVVVEMPNMRMYTAIKGQGAWCEGKNINCSDTKSLERSLLVTGFGYEHGENWDNNMNLFKQFTDDTQGVRRLGAAAVDICHVAKGVADGFWEYDLKPWDTAAGILIAKEAGCMVTDLSGNQFDINDNNILITNGHIHQNMVNNIERYLN